ncbi:hypothetical protein GCM10018780_19830 [Streptomyces lanatus]|nr:hypothetical protein GCM10018780_19830 [Streptomyces lanatus]
MRLVQALVGGLVGVVWLVLPGMTVVGGVAGGAERPVAGAVGQGEDEGDSAVDFVLPVAAIVTAGVLAGYGFLRRRRRARERTTPGGAPGAGVEPPVGELDERARASLVAADDAVRVSAEELGFVAERFGVELDTADDSMRVSEKEVGFVAERFAAVLRDAEAELAVAFRMRWQYEGGVPEEAAARRHALAGIVGRCEEAGRLLDGQAAAFDQVRGLEEGLGGGLGHALVVAEGRFRELTGRAASATTTLAELGERHGPAAIATVAGHAEQAKDRLVFATTHLNHARQSADAGTPDRAATHLRTAESAIAQATTFITGIERLAGDLATAAAMVPAALTGGEVEIRGAREAGVRRQPPSDVPPGELQARVIHADLALAGVREVLVSGRPYDPVELLRRIVRAVAPVVSGRAGVIPVAAEVCARGAVAGADDVVATHRAAVGGEARTRLAEARRLLTSPAPGRELADLVAADTLARQARDLAEQDIRMHGNPVDAPDVGGLAGAVLGGILLRDGAPPSFGGPRTRDRRKYPADS